MAEARVILLEKGADNRALVDLRGGLAATSYTKKKMTPRVKVKRINKYIHPIMPKLVK